MQRIVLALCLAFLAGSALLLGLLAFGYGLGTFGAMGHDARFHLAASTMVGQLQWSGQALLPRWLPHADHGFGAPVLLFYQPLPYWIAAALLDAQEVPRLILFRYGMAVVLALGLSLLTCYGFLRQYFDRMAAAVGAAFYLIAPYHAVVDTIYRGAYAELWGFVALPLLPWAGTVLIRTRRWSPYGLPLALVAVAGALPLLLHVATAIVTLPTVGLVLMVIAWRDARGRLIPLCLGLAAAIGLASFYWLPAALLIGHTAAIDALYSRGINWSSPAFFLGGQLLGDLLPRRIPFARVVAEAQILSALPLIGALMVFGTLKRAGLVPSLWVGVGIWGFFLASVVSYPVWAHLPGLKLVQIPFRMNMLVCFGSAVAAAILVQHLHRPLADRSVRGLRRRSAILLIAAITLTTPLVWSLETVWGHAVVQRTDDRAWHRAMAMIQEGRKIGMVAAEYRLTLGSPMRPRFLNSEEDAIVLAGDVDVLAVTPQADGGLRLRLAVDGEERARLALRRPAFPGWVLRDTRLDQAADRAGTSAPVILDADYRVLILDAAPGTHDVVVERTVLPEVRLGWAISAATALALALAGLVAVGDRRRARAARPAYREPAG